MTGVLICLLLWNPQTTPGDKLPVSLTAASLVSEQGGSQSFRVKVHITNLSTQAVAFCNRPSAFFAEIENAAGRRYPVRDKSAAGKPSAPGPESLVILLPHKSVDLALSFAVEGNKAVEAKRSRITLMPCTWWSAEAKARIRQSHADLVNKSHTSPWLAT